MVVAGAGKVGLVLASSAQDFGGATVAGRESALELRSDGASTVPGLVFTVCAKVLES